MKLTIKILSGLAGLFLVTGLVSCSQHDAAYYSQKASAKLAKGDFDGALTDYNKAIELKPDYVNAFISRGGAKYKKGDPAGALDDYRQAAKIKPNLIEIPDISESTNNISNAFFLRPDAAATTKQVLSLLDSKEYDQLADMADKFRTSKECYADGHWKLEDFYDGLVPQNDATDEEWEKRLTALGQWAVNRPGSITARVAWANVLVEYAWKARTSGPAEMVTKEGWQLFSKRLGEAAQVLKEAKSLKEKCPIYWRIVLRDALGLQVTKLQFNNVFNEAISFDSDFVHFYIRRAIYLLPRWSGYEGEWQSDLIKSADRLGGEKGDLLYARVLWYMHQRYDLLTLWDDPQSWVRLDRGFEMIEKRFTNSLSAKIEHAQLAIYANDAKAAAFYNSGVNKHENGDLLGAMADYNKAIEIKTNYAKAYGNRGNIKRDKGDLEGALADYAKALEIKPDYALAYYSRAQLKQTKRDLAGALADYNRAIECQPDFAIGYYGRGCVKQANQDYKGAIADYSKTIELKPTFADAYIARGNLRQYTGDKLGAADDLNKAATLKTRRQ